MPRLLRYAAAALLLLGLGGLVYYLVHPGGMAITAPQSSRPVGYEPLAGYGDSCELFYPLSFRDDFGSPPAGWIGVDRSKVSFAPGNVVIKPAAGESVVWLDPSIEYQRGFVCAKVQAAAQGAAPAATSGSEEGAGVAFWAADPENYYAAIVYRDGGYAVFRKVNGMVAPLVPKRPSAAVKIGSDDVNVLQILYSEPRYFRADQWPAGRVLRSAVRRQEGHDRTGRAIGTRQGERMEVLRVGGRQRSAAAQAMTTRW
jgi:hypothetical protein